MGAGMGAPYKKVEGTSTHDAIHNHLISGIHVYGRLSGMGASFKKVESTPHDAIHSHVKWGARAWPCVSRG